MKQIYETIGIGYTGARRPDSCIGEILYQALSDAHTVLNVGAGTGNYEPSL